jgi:hypothetical protein
MLQQLQQLLLQDWRLLAGWRGCMMDGPAVSAVWCDELHRPFTIDTSIV